MPHAARMNKLAVPEMEKYVAPTELRINLKEHKAPDGLDVGDTFTMYVKGKVTMVRKDEHESIMTIDVTGITDKEKA